MLPSPDKLDSRWAAEDGHITNTHVVLMSCIEVMSKVTACLIIPDHYFILADTTTCAAVNLKCLRLSGKHWVWEFGIKTNSRDPFPSAAIRNAPIDCPRTRISWSPAFSASPETIWSASHISDSISHMQNTQIVMQANSCGHTLTHIC